MKAIIESFKNNFVEGLVYSVLSLLIIAVIVGAIIDGNVRSTFRKQCDKIDGITIEYSTPDDSDKMACISKKTIIIRD